MWSMDMVRGYSLFETLVVLLIAMVLLMVAVPSVERFYSHYQLRRLAIELRSFFVQVRSEALTRREDLWVYFSFVEGPDSGKWQLRLRNYGPGMQTLQGREEYLFKEGGGERLSANWESLKFSGFSGLVSENDHLLLSTGSQSGPVLKLILHSRAGRARICALNEDFYDFPVC